MANKPKPGVEQAGLFINSEASAQEAINPEFNAQNPVDDPTSVSIAESYIHLQNAINYLFKANTLGGKIVGLDREIGQDPEKSISEVKKRQNVQNNRAAYISGAEKVFILSTGNQKLLDAGLISEWQYKRMNRSMYSKFLVKYSIERHREAAAQYRDKLVENLDQLTAHMASKPEVATSNLSNEELEALDTPGRLRAIYTSFYGGFFPTTHREKNTVLVALDYIKNRNYPLAQNSQFLEVINHTQVIRRKNKSAEMDRGPLSIVYEVEDYLNNAIRQKTNLLELKAKVDQIPNPNALIDPEIDDIPVDHPGYVALIRFRDINKLAQEDSGLAIANPLHTKEDRWTKVGAGKHKIVEDKYTAKIVEPEMAQYISEEASKLTVKEARELLDLALKDQTKRQAFFVSLLKDIVDNIDKAEDQTARVALQRAAVAAKNILDNLQSEDAN